MTTVKNNRAAIAISVVRDERARVLNVSTNRTRDNMTILVHDTSGTNCATIINRQSVDVTTSRFQLN